MTQTIYLCGILILLTIVFSSLSFIVMEMKTEDRSKFVDALISLLN